MYEVRQNKEMVSRVCSFIKEKGKQITVSRNCSEKTNKIISETNLRVVQRINKFLKLALDGNDGWKSEFCEKYNINPNDEYFNDGSAKYDKKLRDFIKMKKEIDDDLSQIPDPPKPVFSKISTKNRTTSMFEIPPMEFEYVPQQGCLKVKITLPPIPALGDNAKIGFIQIVQSNKLNSEALERFNMYNEKYHTEGWSIDRQGNPEPKHPFYGVSDDGTSGENLGSFGSAKESAVMTDCPSYSGNEQWHPIFQTRAVIMECPQYKDLEGTVLSAIEWEFQYEPNNKEIRDVKCKEISDKTDEFVRAVDIWNEKYKNNTEWVKVQKLFNVEHKELKIE